MNIALMIFIFGIIFGWLSVLTERVYSVKKILERQAVNSFRISGLLREVVKKIVTKEDQKND